MERLLGSLATLVGSGFISYNLMWATPVSLNCKFNNEVVTKETNTLRINDTHNHTFTRTDGSTIELDWRDKKNNCTITPNQKP